MAGLPNFWRQLRGSFLYGRALMRFQQGRFAECARMLEEVCSSGATEGSTFRTYAYLGRSYFALGERQRATENLTRAYELFDSRDENNLDPSEVAEVVRFLNLLKELLLESGETDNVIDVEIRRLDDITNRQVYDRIADQF